MKRDSTEVDQTESCLTTLVETRNIELYPDSNSASVIFAVRHMADQAGFKLNDSTMIATAASELATNIIRYAGKGVMVVSVVKNTCDGIIGIELQALDNGPGIENVERAMQDQYSSLSDSLGLGLPSVKRIMDDFVIESIPGKGTRVRARKWKRYG